MDNVNRAQVVDVHELINTLHAQATSNEHELVPVTLSGSVVSFNDPIGDLSLQECVVDIEPVQSGSGDPSPSNVRPISGWSEVNVYVSPTQSEQDATEYHVSLGQTVYGGTLDVVTGVLTVDRAMVDLGTLTWSRFTTLTEGKYRFGSAGINALIKKPSSLNVIANIICTNYIAIKGSDPNANVTGVGIHTNGNVVIFDPAYETALADAFKTAMNGVQLVYELATPTTVQLTPTEVKTLQGTNTIWADSGDITVTYLSYE